MRLVDMQINEVSYVDKAANRRKFLLVKRDEPKAPAEDKKVEEPKEEPKDEEITPEQLALIEKELSDITELLKG